MLCGMDVLANVLAVTKLGNTVLGQAELLPPWGLEVGPQTKAAVHLVQRGTCWLRLEGESEPTRLVHGDVVLVARGSHHTLTDSPKTPAEPYAQALDKMKHRVAALREPAVDSTVLLCAEYDFDQEGPHPLLALLPKLIHIPADAAQEDGPLQKVVRLLLLEASAHQSGADLVVPRLVDVLLVYVVRAWLNRQPQGGAGWFGALRDPQIGRALSLIHQSPERAWTVAELANEVAQSRAAFARRFHELVGEPPLAYLTRWRMSLAAKLLRTTDAAMDSIATQVGYESPTAFGKAFRKHVNMSPGRCRSMTRASQNTPRQRASLGVQDG
jgi:AraC-like DNA-binding protein